jgi:hypothetical protein
MNQPQSVVQIAARLLPAYTVDGGRVYLAGCTLEDRLLARLAYQTDGKPSDLYVDVDGRPLDAADVKSLGLERWAPLEKPPQAATAALDRLLTVGLPAAEERCRDHGPHELLSLTALWCKFVEGKVRFSIGPHTRDLPFSGWAQTLEPPPYICPSTGRPTFHLSMTDPGQIVAHESLACCDATGRHVASGDLVTCSITGRQVLSKLTQVCPLTGQAVLASAMVACAMCAQSVSPAAVKHGRCIACRNLQAVDKADPRIARVLREFPELARWDHWRISEMAAVWVLVASGWLKQLLVVVDRDSLELRTLATANRLARHWQIVPPVRHSEVLKG